MADDRFRIYIDDSAFGVATGDVGAIGMLADETAPDSVDEGDIGIPRMTLDRKQLNVIVDATTDSQRLAIDSNGSASAILAANSGVDIGDVDVTSIIPGTGATNLGKAEDAAHTTGDVGVMSLAVRNDAGTALAATDGDYIPLTTDSSGALRTTASITINAEKVDDSAFTVATDTVNVSGYLADETTPDSVDEGDVGAARMTLDRKQLMVLVDATTDSQRLGIDSSGNAQVILAANNGVDVGDVTINNAAGASAVNIQDGGNSITVDGTVSVDNITTSVTPGTGATNLGKAVDSAGGATDTGVAALFLRDDALTTLTPADGDYVRGRTTSTGALWTRDTVLDANSETTPLFVQQVTTGVSASEVHDYNTATVAASATSNHDYTVTGTTFLLKSIIFASSGGSKVEVQTGPVASLVTKAVSFIPVGVGGQVQLDFNPPIEVPVTSTGTVRLIRTNRQGASQDLYSTIIGNDV